MFWKKILGHNVLELENASNVLSIKQRSRFETMLALACANCLLQLAATSFNSWNCVRPCDHVMKDQSRKLIHAETVTGLWRRNNARVCAQTRTQTRKVRNRKWSLQDGKCNMLKTFPSLRKITFLYYLKSRRFFVVSSVDREGKTVDHPTRENCMVFVFRARFFSIFRYSRGIWRTK